LATLREATVPQKAEDYKAFIQHIAAKKKLPFKNGFNTLSNSSIICHKEKIQNRRRRLMIKNLMIIIESKISVHLEINPLVEDSDPYQIMICFG
jgi:uncharacterized protein (DUF1919 family)